MNKQDFKKYLPESVINTRRFIRRKARRFKKFLQQSGKPYFYKVSTENESFYISINPYKNGCVDEVIETEGAWEPDLVFALKKLMNNDSVFLDIGSNIGYHSIAIATAFPIGQVICFEPQESLCEQIRKSVSKNNLKNVTIFQVGLSDIEEEVLIHIPEENVGGSSVIKGLNNHTAFKKADKIKLKTLDSFDAEIPRIDVVKIDVEGLEPNVLRGAEQIFAKHRPIIVMEFSPIIYQYANPEIANQLLALIVEMQYEVCDIYSKPLDLLAWMKEADNSTKGQIDIICFPR